MSVICFLVEAQFSFLTSCTFLCKYRRVMLENILQIVLFSFRLQMAFSRKTNAKGNVYV